MEPHQCLGRREHRDQSRPDLILIDLRYCSGKVRFELIDPRLGARPANAELFSRSRNLLDIAEHGARDDHCLAPPILPRQA
jgi:hypothetical protein